MDDVGEDVLVLHTLRLIGFGEAPVVAQRLGVDVEVVVRHLESAQQRAWVTYHRGRIAGWSLTAAGRVGAQAALAAGRDRAGVTAPVSDHYRRFVPLNGRFLALCTDWQLVDSSISRLNDHADGDYDAAVISRLRVLDGHIQPIVAGLAGLLTRFGHYGGRLSRALERVDAGDFDWFTKPTVDSYHSVWFELHEDLLATLGLQRSSEQAGSHSGSGE